MAFSIYALLGEGAAAMTNESLAVDLEHFFRAEEGFSIQFEQLPFAKDRTLALRWAGWLVRVSYEEGAEVVGDSDYISNVLGSAAPCKVASIDRRIRVLFGDDETQKYTNQIIYMIDFLREIPGVIMFDPQQKDIIN